MTHHDDFDRTLAGWFEADALAPAPAGDLDRVLDATRRRRSRPAWLSGPGSEWVGAAPDADTGRGMRTLRRSRVRWSTALLVLLAVAALVGGTILIGARFVHPSLLPTGRLGDLAYGLDGDIFVADWDGRNPVRIADGSPALDPTGGDCGTFGGEGRMWSPDGRHLAYRGTSCLTGEGRVFISDPEGHMIVSFPGTGWLVSWSPDSTRVAIWVDLFKTIGIYGLDGVRQALLTIPTGCALPGDFDPVWSPDGRSLVVVPCELPIDGSKPRRLPVGDPRSHVQEAYSPNRARAAYVINDGSLNVADADGSNPRVLVAEGVSVGGFRPMWSPTGDRIVYDASPSLSEPNEIRIVDVASGKVTPLTAVGAIGPSHLLSFSAEGDRVLFWQADTNDVHSLWTVDADGSNARPLVQGSDMGDWQTLPAGP